MYVVLFFEKSCAAVPNIWVREKENQCWWPPKGVNVKKAVSERIPHENNWPLYPFHKLWGPYGKSISLYNCKKNMSLTVFIYSRVQIIKKITIDVIWIWFDTSMNDFQRFKSDIWSLKNDTLRNKAFDTILKRSEF